MLQSLKLRSFRNYAGLELLPGRGVNVLFGPNAQGKTNVLEAIHLLAQKRSHRAEKDAEMVKWGDESYSVNGHFSHETSEFDVAVTYTEAKGKVVRINGLTKKAAERLYPEVQVVLFVPDDLQMIKGPAAMRRAFLDQEIAQVSSAYAYDLSRYNKVLSQRNSLLRNGLSPGDPLLGTFTDQLVEHGVALYKRRLSALRRLVPVAREVHAHLTKGEVLDVIYRPSIPTGASPTDQELRDAFAKRLAERADLERIRQMTLVGPHRDDIVFMISGRDARHFGSQGQQRSVVVSMKVSELNFINQETGRFPILLLDDILSELDASRRHGLLSAVTEEVQIFLTCTDYSPFESELPRETVYYRVREGTLEEHARG